MRNLINTIYISMLSDLTEFFRIKSTVFSTCLTPLIMILSFGLGADRNQFLFIAPAIFAIGTMFSCTFSVGYTIIVDRQRRLINDIVLSPISYSSFVVARVLGGVIKCSIQLIVTVLIAIIFLKAPLYHPFLLAIAFILTAIFFGGTGMVFGSFSNALNFPGFVNIILMPFMFFCGVFFPVSNFKQLAGLIQCLPFTASVELFRFTVIDKIPLGALIANLSLLVIYSIVVVSLGIFMFKRTVIRR